MKGSDLVDRLAASLATPSSRPLTDNELAVKLDVVPMTIRNWRLTKEVKASAVARMVVRACDKAQANAEQEALRPIVEFFPLDVSTRRKRSELFVVRPTGDKDDHPYRVGLRNKLQASHGVYLFYDSRGRALYSGKADKTNLWSEMNSALNRARDDVQQVKRVRHPKSRKAFGLSSETTRQITPQTVKLSDIAAYVSAYEVSKRLIGTMESLLIRSFANDLLNVKMERFGGGLQTAEKVAQA